MSELGFPSEKFADPELLQRAVDGVAERATVLIELAIPRQQARVRPMLRNGVKKPAVVGVEPESAAQRLRIKRATTEAEAFLTEVLGEPPRWIQVARVFVANPSGEQLRTIACSDLVKVIRPNRKLR